MYSSVHGDVYDHPVFEDGQSVMTSMVQSIIDDRGGDTITIRTISGTIYDLEASDYTDLLRAIIAKRSSHIPPA